MSVRALTLADSSAIALCVNETFADWRSRGALIDAADWDAQTARDWAARGYRGYGWFNPQDVLGACVIGRIEQLVHQPVAAPEPWLVVPVLAVRLSLVADIDREKATLRAFGQAVASIGNTVGTTMQAPANMARLLAFLRTFTNIEEEPGGPGLVRVWFRNRPGRPELTARVLDAGV